MRKFFKESFIYLVSSEGNSSRENQRIETTWSGNILEKFAEIFFRKRIFSTSNPGLVLQLPLLDEPGLFLELLQHQVLVFVELDAFLVQFIHRVHHGSQLSLQSCGCAQVEILISSRRSGKLILNLQKEGVHQMGVFDDDRDLGEHRLETDVEILDLVRGEVVVLEHLDCVLGHPVGF